MTEKQFQQLPTDDEKTGTFTYESYLEHLEARSIRTEAEIDGFKDAAMLPNEKIGNTWESHDNRTSYETGFYLGQLYLKKKEQGT